MKVLETHQLMLDQINERLVGLNWSDQRDVRSLHQMLAHSAALLPQVASIAIVDTDGNLRAASLAYPADRSMSFADRDWFRALKASDQPLPFISRATIGRLSGLPVFNVAARVKGPVAGQFYGAVTIAIKKSYFVDFYRSIERKYWRRHLIILAREDGAVLASEPDNGMTMLPSNALFRLALESRAPAFLVHPAVIDGTKRIFGYEKVGMYPVVIGFGIPWTSALAPWWHNMWAYGLVAALSSVTLLGVSGFAIRRIALEGRATMRWRRSTALLESEMAERARIEEQFRQSQKMEAVGRLTGGIAHDFNNLLTVVMGSLDLLSRRMKDADPRQLALLKNAVDGASRAATLTARLLAFSRQHPLEPAALDVNALVNDMASLLQRTLAENVSIDYALADGLWTTFVDPNQLENAILNLCVNAVDAMPKGGTLRIATANVSLDEALGKDQTDVKPGAYVDMSVADTGTGMPPDVLGRAFEPFFTTKPVGKGTGLGLSQVYGFARQSGGHATIESQIGKGTTISLYLPRLAAGTEAKPAPAPLDVRAAAEVRSSSGATILIVEDDDLVRTFSSAALREGGYSVLEAATGPDGLERLGAHPEIALLFTDVVLKGPLNGRELADQALSLRQDLPVLFTTGYTKDAIVHQGRLDEGLNFIGKPFTTAALAAKIAELLPQRSAEDRRRDVE